MTTGTGTHTPGPWHIDELDDSTWRILGDTDKLPTHLQDICELMYTSGNAEANARLIAAAPLMLAALEFVNQLEFSDPDDAAEAWPEAVSKVRAAIALAKGGTE